MLPLHWMKKSFVGPVFVLRKETQLFPAWRDSLVVAAAQIGDCRYLLTEDLQVNQTLGNINIIKPFHTSPESLKERWTSVSSPQLLKPPPCLEIEIHAAAFFMGCSGYTTTFPTSRPPMIAQGITKTLSAADYRERRLKDLEDRRNSEMWRAGAENASLCQPVLVDISIRYQSIYWHRKTDRNSRNSRFSYYQNLVDNRDILV